MLDSLYIENVALIRRMELNFAPGFTVLTGETGAGKSIIIDSVILLQGGRADRDLIRSGESEAMVSAVFSNISQRILDKLDALGVTPDVDGRLLIQRKISTDGRSVSKINGRGVTVGVLGEIGKTLISIYGQHENVELIDPERHIDYLDTFSGNTAELGVYRSAYAAYLDARAAYDSLRSRATGSARACELLAYQIKDISAAKLKIGEEKVLEERKIKLKNAEKISKNAKIVKNKGISAVAAIEAAVSALGTLDGIIDGVGEKIEKLTDYRYEIESIAEEIGDIEVDSDDPETELDKIEGRLDVIAKLERKYGATIEDVLAYERQAREELSAIENIDDLIADSKTALDAAEGSAKTAADVLSQTRGSAARRFEAAMIEQLRFLDMAKVRFIAAVSRTPMLTQKGVDAVEFLISTNPGEPPKNLGKIASGGELSRIMLANRAVMADKEGTPSLIFDEIDTGISGKTSERLGIKLRDISKNAQVFCVTHAAQIAAIAETHYKVAKRDEDGRTETHARILSKSERVEELASLFAGINVTENARKTAAELLEKNKTELSN